MASDNIFSGLKVVDLASFIAGPGAAVILSDFGADVIKVEPPTGDTWRIGYKIPPQPRAKDNYPWHLNNRNKRGLALDLKSPEAREVLRRLVEWADVLIVNTPHPAREKLKLGYDDVAPWNPRLIYADVTGYGDNGPDATASGIRHHGLLGAKRPAVTDARCRCPADAAGSGQRRPCDGGQPLFGNRHRTLPAGTHRKGSYVTTSLLAAGVWASAVSAQAALADATFFPLHDRANPPNATFNVYRAADDTWFVIVLTPDKWPALVNGIGRPDLLTDARFADPAKQAANSAQLTAILDQTFASQPMAHWREVFEQAHLTFGVVQAPSEVIKDPQLRANDIVVPLDGAGGNLKFTISSPLQVHGVAKVPARRAPELGEHSEEILKQLGFNANEIDSLRASGAVPKARGRAA